MIMNCTIDELKKYLIERLSPKRYLHSLNVAEYAARIAALHGVDQDNAYIAGLLHDCGRTMSDEQLVEYASSSGVKLGNIELLQPVLLHAPCGANIASKYFGVHDEDVLAAIRNHTVAAPYMSDLEMVIYLADILEPGRKFTGIKKLRKSVEQSLVQAMLGALDQSIEYVLDTGRLLHPDTVAARNELLTRRREYENIIAKTDTQD